MERCCNDNCWRDELEEEVRIFMTHPVCGFDLEVAIEWASECGYDTVITVVF